MCSHLWLPRFPFHVGQLVHVSRLNPEPEQSVVVFYLVLYHSSRTWHWWILSLHQCVHCMFNMFTSLIVNYWMPTAWKWLCGSLDIIDRKRQRKNIKVQHYRELYIWNLTLTPFPHYTLTDFFNTLAAICVAGVIVIRWEEEQWALFDSLVYP